MAYYVFKRNHPRESRACWVHGVVSSFPNFNIISCAENDLFLKGHLIST